MNHQRLTPLLITIASALAVVACGKTNDPSKFGAGQASFDTSQSSVYVASFKWKGPFIADADPNMAQAWDVNSDMIASCQSMFTNGGSQRGCMQPPPVVYSDNRWFAGFTQNYLWSGAWLANTLNSGFATMTSLASRAFGNLGAGLGLIDPGFVFTTAAPNPLSVRYLRFASFPNGNVVAVYIVENTTTFLNGTVFATVYSSSNHQWGAAVRLGTTANRTNYNASDYQQPAGTFYLTRQCRPTVATSGNNSAMASWCEDTGAGAASLSEIMYARYVGGVWTKLAGGSAIGNPDQLVTNTVALNRVVSTPGYNGIFHYLSRDVNNNAVCTMQSPPEYIIGSFTDDTWGLYFSTDPTNRYRALVKAVTANPGLGEFLVVKDVSNTVKVCETLQNMANAMLSTVPTDMISGADCGSAPTQCIPANKTFSQMGVSVIVDSACDNSNDRTWNIGVYHNRALNNLARDPSGAIDNSVVSMQRGITATASMVAGSPTLTVTDSAFIGIALTVSGSGIPAGTTVIAKPTGTTVTLSANATTTQGGITLVFLESLSTIAACAQAIPSTPQDAAFKSGAVDVAGDGFGNYALVRSVIAPVLQQSGSRIYNTTTSLWDYSNGIDGTADSKGRMLVGHQYLASGSWLTSSKSTGRNSLLTQSPGCTAFASATTGPVCPVVAAPAAALLKTDLLSNAPTCDTGAVTGTKIGPNESVACSVRNPRILMSSSGKGIILFHQNQPQPYVTSQAAPATVAVNPNRLWWTTYSTSSGYGGVASPLDQDTFCSTSSVRNDRPVCETGSYEANFTNITATFSTNCQSFEEGRNWSKLPGTPIVKPPVTIDVPPIAAAMNASGQGVIAYNKVVNTGTALSPLCTNIGTWVVTYDSFNGMSSATQLDDGLGNTIHANVGISASGKMAVIWEERAPLAAPTATYIYLRTYSNGAWSSQSQVNDGLTDHLTSGSGMFPSVGINDLGEVVATFTYGGPVTGNVRHQYIKHYYYY